MQSCRRLCLIIILAALPLTVSAQNYDPAQLEQLVAPIALYPDPLLFPLLTATEYPKQIAEASEWTNDARFGQTPPDVITDELRQMPWHDSVKYLTAYPQFLRTLSDNDSWTQSIGHAYATQPYDVMDAIQNLRHDAREAGTLFSNQQVTVIDDGNNVLIKPFDAQNMLVPTYDPAHVYGEWISRQYPPYAFVARYHAPVIVPATVIPETTIVVTRTIFPVPVWGVQQWDRREHEDHAFQTSSPAVEHHQERHNEIHTEEHQQSQHHSSNAHNPGVAPTPVPAPVSVPAPAPVSTPAAPAAQPQSHSDAPKPLGLIQSPGNQLPSAEHHEEHHDTPHDDLHHDDHHNEPVKDHP